MTHQPEFKMTPGKAEKSSPQTREIRELTKELVPFFELRS